MKAPHRIEIPCKPANPVNYLACCGIFDLVSRTDATALAHWEAHPPVRIVLQTLVAEHNHKGTASVMECDSTSPSKNETLKLGSTFSRLDTSVQHREGSQV